MAPLTIADIELTAPRVLLAGDVHGYTAGVDSLAVRARRAGAPLILQVGDFGFWPHTDPRYVAKCDRILAREGCELWWIDGNHENFELLWNREHPVDENGLVVIGDHVRYIPRGHRFRLNGVSFLGMGGAVSHDKSWRTGKEKKRRKEHQQSRWFWWHEEALTEQQIAEAIAGGPCDVLLCHDAPEGIDLRGIVELSYDRDDFMTGINRRLLRDLVLATRPALIAHGHYHEQHNRPFYHPSGITIDVAGLADWKRTIPWVKYVDENGETKRRPKLDHLGREYRWRMSYEILDLDEFKRRHPDRFSIA